MEHGSEAGSGAGVLTRRMLRRRDLWRQAEIAMGRYTPCSRAEEKQVMERAHEEDVEAGLVRAILSREMLRPARHDRSWLYCSIVRDQADHFRMVADGDDRLMLCAIRKNRDYYISHLESFLGAFSSTGSLRGAVAVVRQLSDRRFRLYSYSCEMCGGAVGSDACAGPMANGVVDALPSSHQPLPRERQILLDVEHADHTIHNVNARQATLHVPNVLHGPFRCVWCPRAPRGAYREWVRSGRRRPLSRQHYPPPSQDEDIDGISDAMVAAAPSGSLTVDAAARAEAAGRDGATPDTVTLKSRLPVWSRRERSLSLRFVGSRVLEASTKNFLFAMPDASGTEKPVLQYGRVVHGSYHLDVRFPLAPVQAFAAFLTGFSWKGELT